MAQYEVTLAGFGGQGVMTAGQLLAYTAMAEEKQVIWLPSYGPEMRGGTAFCTVVISDVRIGSPVISTPQGACVFNRPSFDKFGPRVKKDGLLIINSSLIDVTSDRTDIKQILIPANAMGMKVGNPKAANIAIVGAFVGATDVVQLDNVAKMIAQKMARKKNVLDKNLEVLNQGYQMAKEQMAQKRKRMNHDMSKLSEIIDRYPRKPESLIAVLQDIQREYNYLPCDALKEAAVALDVPLSKVFSVSTFYNAFSLTPKGDKIVRVCIGTACHIRGAEQIKYQLESQLGVKVGGTTKDLKYTLEVVGCVGACAMAPVVIVNDKYCGDVKVSQTKSLLKKG